MKPTPLFAGLVLGIWLGLYALRSFVPAAVWNLSDELPLNLKALLAVATQVLALLGALIVVKWRRRTLLPLAIAFAIVTVARQLFIAADQVGPWLSLLSWPLWLWFMAALADEVAAHDADTLVAPATATAIALQLGMQSAWHGLDLPTVRGVLAITTSAILAVLLVFAIKRIPPAHLPRPHTPLVWLLLGPALFLEATLVGNIGRFSENTGLALLTAAIVLQITLLAAVLIATRFTRFSLRVGLIALGLIALFALPGVRGLGALIVLIVQVIVVCGLREAADRRIRISAATAFTIGAFIHFVLLFAFYNAYELTPLWLLVFAPLAVMAGLAQRAGDWPGAGIAPYFTAGCAIALLHLIPAPPSGERDGRTVAILSYNIHHGFDDDGVPGMQQTANEIARMNPDLVAFQEISRGWTMLGGNDLVAYLKWRFPHYHIHFTPLNGQLWGNAIMSRLPVEVFDGGAFVSEPGVFRYGWTSAYVVADGARLLFFSAHVTSDLEGPMGDARVAQVGELQDIINGLSPVVVAGDFNAHPDDAPIQSFKRVVGDLGGDAGLAGQATWPAGRPNERIDYIFGRGVTAVGGSIPRITASDHLPVLIRIRIDDTTALR